MDSEEDFMELLDSEMQPCPPPVKGLKRLRKATDNIPKDPSPDCVEPSSFLDVNSDSSTSDPSNRAETDSEEDANTFHFDGFKDGIELFDSEDVAEEYKSGAAEVEIQNEELRADLGLDLERSKSLDGSEKNGEIKKKKKRVKRNSNDLDELPTAAATKKMRDKERRELLRDLRSESQRLLRETRDASFKPVPLAQMSVSSVLEKIRKRKHEISKRNSLIEDDCTTSRGFALEFDFEDSPIEDIELKVTEANSKETTCCAEVEGSLGTQSVHESTETTNGCHKNATPKMAPRKKLGQMFRDPVDDTQDFIFDSQNSDTKDQQSDELLNSPPEGVTAPSLLAMNLKLDSAPLDDYSSDEEENDKENIDPYIQGSVDLPSPLKGDPVKAFVDDEAEEEDDSDNDLARFKDKEEEEDIMDSEELNDIIASGYEEKPMDNELRNQLHQKWLEQQDAAGTENLLQRLKCSTKQKDMALIEEEEDEESEGAEDEFPDDPAEYVIPKNVVRMNLKKAKEMICQMFTDKDDVYFSSDEEETEERLVKQQLSDKTEEQAKFLSPAEDESSKDIFGLIKKLNAAPDIRRRAKITSHFCTRSIGHETTSKSSFLSRRSRNMPASIQKHGPSTVRSFVFERDDSNSRSAITMLEDSSEVVQKENRPKKTASAKYSSSQVRSRSQSTQTVAENNAGPSLHEILRCQLVQSSHTNQGGMASHVEAIYASFRLDQSLVKKERGLSIRTAYNV